jgi:PAS domain S-box-containing protein
MIFHLDCQGRFLYYKADTDELFADPGCFIGKTVQEVMPDWFAELTVEKIKKTTDTGTLQIYEYSLEIPGKGLQHYECRMVPFNLTDVLATVRNVTAQVMFHREISEKEAHSRALMEATNDVFILLRKDGVIIDCNEAHAKRLGKTRTDIIGQDVFRLLPEDVSRERRKNVLRVIKTGKPVFFQDFRGSYWNEIAMYPIFIDGRQTDEVAVYAKDISDRIYALEALKKSEDRLRKTVIAANNGIWDWDLATGVVSFDERYYTMAGYEPDEFPYRLDEFQRRVHPDDLDEVMNAARRHLNGYANDFIAEFRFRKKSGDYMWIRGKGRTVERGENGEPVRFVGTHEDIHTIKQINLINDCRLRLLLFSETHNLQELLEETLNEAEHLTGSQIGFYHFVEDDQQTIILRNWSAKTKQTFCKVAGYEVKYPVARAGVWIDCLKARSPVIHNDYASLPGKRGMPEGHAEVIRELVVPVIRGQKVVAILGVGNKGFDYQGDDVDVVSRLADQVWDIAERKVAQESLRASEEKYRSLFENMSQGIFYQDSKGKVIDANGAAVRMFGITLSQFLGKDSFDPRWRVIDENHNEIPPEDHPSMTALRTGKPVENQTVGVFIPETGCYNWLIIDAIPQFRPGDSTPYQVFVTMQDITRRKEAEEMLLKRKTELRELNAQKDRFLSIIAHDLKSPFNAILGFSNLMVEQLQSGDYNGLEQHARIVQQSSERAMELLVNLMEWARSQTGRIEFNPEFFELNSVIGEILALMEEVAHQKNIALKNLLSHNLPVYADKPMISTVIRNLVSNALKFTPDYGEVTISARIAHLEVVISVADTGIGIPAERINKLFRIDEGFSTPGTRKERGTGLGLILCKEFIDKHKGKIWAESTVNSGSRFHFSLPLPTI